MALSETDFRINIADNGRGFDLGAIESQSQSPMIPNGDGLTNMQRRLADIGGQYRIESSPGIGTSVMFIIPLNNHPKYTN
jgi:signal transduction histidine kinase